ncbi:MULTISPECIES: hypothetical protein [Rhizobium]|uniref:hypothetical protein n=1 Tax=Rhizobium TaxID=379 RepID=UPI00195C0EE9|nr:MULTISPECIES: hypothetical protein [Rhizobium]
MTGNRTIIDRAARASRPVLTAALDHIRCFGTLLREAAAVAFAIRCKVIDGR